MSESNTPIVDIYWEGPFSGHKEVKIYVNDDARGKETDYFFYQIYGNHQVYGKDVLLYIGLSNNGSTGVVDRLEKHAAWISKLPSEVTIYIGSFGKFTEWVEWHKKRFYTESDNPDVLKPNFIESLLIFAHQPCVNSASKASPSFGTKAFRIFNTGRKQSLFPEISTQYYKDIANVVKESELK